ncbi:uncharacterized protein HKW66_Vig0121010 [Vigna angularis]|uniref:Peptidase A1 domain-containing protein n=1 Tax=Phaseolus angularis TaxID=3914 RepID=A0A8T0JWG1_PHAAN|nr:uncharacterized protein HKW66_Vig0121010 [Vigna angularis]
MDPFLDFDYSNSFHNSNSENDSVVPVHLSTMTSSSLLLPLSLTLLYLLSAPSSIYKSSLALPVIKDHSTHQYLTTLSYGTPVEEANFVLDLGGSSLWVDCASRTAPSASLATIFHRSVCCLTAKGLEIETHRWLSSLANPVIKTKRVRFLPRTPSLGKGLPKESLWKTSLDPLSSFSSPAHPPFS